MRFPELILQTYPYPLAVAAKRFNDATEHVERFLCLAHLIEITIKYLAAVAVVQYLRDDQVIDSLQARLAKLARPTLGYWNELLHATVQHYHEHPDRPFAMPELRDGYATKHRTGDPGMTELLEGFRFVARYLGKEREVSWKQISLQNFLDLMVQYRNHTWGHGIIRLDADNCNEHTSMLQPALMGLLQQSSFVSNCPLRYVHEARMEKGQCVHTMYRYMGVSPSQDTPYIGPYVHERRLYLCSVEGEPLLSLHPLLVVRKRGLYILEFNDRNEEVTYTDCATGEQYEPQLLESYRITRLADDRRNKLGNIELPVPPEDQPSPSLTPPELTLPELLDHLSDDACQALTTALGESLRLGHFWLGVEFLLMGLSRQDVLAGFLEAIGMEPGNLRGALRGLTGVRSKDWREQRDVEAIGAAAIADLQAAVPATLAKVYGTEGMPRAVLTPRMMAVLREAVRLTGDGKAGPQHLLLVALQHPQCVAVNLLLAQAVQAGWKVQDVPAWVAQQAGLKPPAPEQRPERPPDGPAVRPAGAGDAEPPSFEARGVLATCGRDLTDLAQHGRLRPAVGESAKKAMLQMGLILQQTEANNPILLGDPGVGKTAIVEGFVHRLATDPKVVAQLAGRRVVDLSPAALLAGTKYRGELEERLQRLVSEVQKSAGQIVVFIDEIHTILGGRAEGGLGAIADVLKPALSRGEFPCIGATTVGGYRRYIEADPALARRFTPVWIEEPTVEEAIEIAGKVAQEHLRPSHRVEYPQEVVKEAVRLSVRYLHDERLPGKAIKLLDQAGPLLVMGRSLSGQAEADGKQPAGGVVTVEIVREIVSERTGIPLTRLNEGESQRLLQLEDILRERVKGQDEATTQVARVVKRARAGLADPRRPLGVFLFAGPTGVGKTELALALAEALFVEEDAILRLDMSEYMEKHQVSRLIGSPPGYVGYEEEGQLTGHLRRRPYSVVLLDEVEKAHKDVQHLFLQLFDAGRLTDARGNLADGRNAIFVMTTNLGAKVPIGFAKAQMLSFEAQMQAAIEDHFTPEFLNRIDRIVYFEPLDEDTLVAIFDRLFQAMATRLREQGIEVEVTEKFKRSLCRRHTDATRGARLLQRAIEDEIVAPLTDGLLAGKVKPGTKVVVGAGAEWEMSEASAHGRAEGPIGEQPPPKAQAPLVGQPDFQMPAAADLDMDPQEARNREAMARPLEGLKGQLRPQEIEITLADGAYELLCSPFWADQREGLSAEDAFEGFVRAPLMQRVQRGEFQAGDRVEVYRNADLKIDFRKLEGEKQ